MHIALITPYPPASRNGNAHTALRWARFLRAAGHPVTITVEWDGRPADLMIALHARRSHRAIAAFAQAFPHRPLIVVLTGTDLYRDIRMDPSARQSLELASRLVVLQERGSDELAAHLHAKTRVIYQSAPSVFCRPKRLRTFDICVVAHLREEKDPLRAAYASELLPADSRIRVLHVGEALTPVMAEEAERCRQFLRWKWLGSRRHRDTRRIIAGCRLLVQSSRMEGGANSIVEAVTAGVPVLASDIPGNVGMLGEAYSGYYPLADSRALAALMYRAETDAAFCSALAVQCADRAPVFEPARERGAVQKLIDECMSI
jgi:putative glycosyltransferase (TIGR04348 family)